MNNKNTNNNKQSTDILVNNSNLQSIETNTISNAMEDMTENSNRFNYNYGSINEWTPFRNNEVINNNIDIQTNDRLNESPIFVTNGSNATHSRLGLPFSNDRYKPSEDVVSNDESIYASVRNDYNYDKYDANKSCFWSHPQVKSHCRVFLAAFGLLIVGIGLISMGVIVIIFPEIGFQSYVFFIAGIICFIPGAYHVVYVYCAVKGRRGYEFHQLPLFN